LFNIWQQPIDDASWERMKRRQEDDQIHWRRGRRRHPHWKCVNNHRKCASNYHKLTPKPRLTLRERAIRRKKWQQRRRQHRRCPTWWRQRRRSCPDPPKRTSRGEKVRRQQVWAIASVLCLGRRRCQTLTGQEDNIGTSP